MEALLFAFLTSLTISFLSIPSIIRISKVKHLFDVPDERKVHIAKTPTLGGIGIFGGLIFSLTFWSDQKLIQELQYILAAVMILFFVGVKDDLLNIRAFKKLLTQIVAAFIIVHWTDIRLTTFYGLFGIWDINTIFSYVLSIFTISVITNSFNLIDGIDGLAATVGIITASAFGTWFFLMDSYQYAIVAFSLVGSLFGFLYYNWSPAKIFMGDTGSLIVGFVVSLLSVKFIEMNRVMDKEAIHKVLSVPVVTIGILIIPLLDTFRVFVIRLSKGRSPFAPDRNHLHHLLLDIGNSHRTATLLMAGFNLLMISIVYFLQGEVSGEALLLIVLAISAGAASFLSWKRRIA